MSRARPAAVVYGICRRRCHSFAQMLVARASLEANVEKFAANAYEWTVPGRSAVHEPTSTSFISSSCAANAQAMLMRMPTYTCESICPMVGCVMPLPRVRVRTETLCDSAGSLRSPARIDRADAHGGVVRSFMPSLKRLRRLEREASVYDGDAKHEFCNFPRGLADSRARVPNADFLDAPFVLMATRRRCNANHSR